MDPGLNGRLRARPLCLVDALGGLILGEWEEKETGRKRRYYHITGNGRAALTEKVQSWNQLCQAVNRILEKSDGQA